MFISFNNVNSMIICFEQCNRIKEKWKFKTVGLVKKIG